MFHRQSIRLQGYDYSQSGYYFVTICTHDRHHFFGTIHRGMMCLSNIGQIAYQCWIDIPKHFPNVSLDAFIIMPNHVHGIIMIQDGVGVQNISYVRVQNLEPVQTHFEPVQQYFKSIQNPRNQYQKIISRSLGSMIRGYKIGVTKWCRQHTDIHTVWHRNYYEHIIRNEYDLHRIRQYILNNPRNWKNDREHE